MPVRKPTGLDGRRAWRKRNDAEVKLTQAKTNFADKVPPSEMTAEAELERSNFVAQYVADYYSRAGVRDRSAECRGEGDWY